MARTSLIACALLAATTSSADDAPLAASAEPITGDGRSVAVVTIANPPAPGPSKALPVPEVARIRCTGASALAASANQPPAVLAPTVTKPDGVDCVARQRDVEAKFRVALTPPAPGLYASATTFDVKSTAREITLDAFVWDGTARAPAMALKAAASEGKLAVQGDKLVLQLAGNAPRLIAIALADGDRLGAAFVPVTGVTTLPVESEPGASVQCWVAGQWFGPVKTKGKIASVPIEVPPGITHGVARSTGRAGYITDAITDLKIPARPRIAAALAAKEVRVGDPVTLAIAVAGGDGRPAGASTNVIGTAKRGKLARPTSLGGGLWSVQYTAPTTPGPDRVTIRIDGDTRAGTAEVEVPVAAGNVARIAIEVPPGPYEPGAELAGTARVLDAAGNPARGAVVTATIGGAPLTVTPGDPIAFRGRVPERLPEGELAVEVSSSGVRERVAVKTAGTAATANVETVVDGRVAVAELAVRDRFGNLVPEGSFEVTVTGGRVQRLERGKRAFRAAVVADEGVASAQLVVRANGRVLAERRVRFDPPAHAYVLGAWVAGGWVDNLGELASPRGGAGVIVRRGVGGVELAGLLGVDVLVFRDTTPVTLDGMTRDADRAVDGVGMQAALRARVRLARRFGLALGAGVVPMRVRATLDTTRTVETVVGLRAQLQGDFKLGPGRVFLGGAYGRATLSEGVVVGKIEGVAVVAGYEWWFADFGW